MTSMPSAAPAASPSPYVKEVTVQNFMQEVVQASLQVPVLVYFTASWCGPCKQFGPLLEKVVNNAKGRVRLARVDIDKNPQVAQQFRIQSVPMIYVFLQGQPMDGFSGVLPESQLKQLIEQVAGPSQEQEAAGQTLIMAEQLLAEGNAAEAAHYFEAILAADPQNLNALAGFAGALIAEGETAQAEALLKNVPDAQANHEKIQAAKAALSIALGAPGDTNLEALKTRVAANPADFEARFELAPALFAAGKQEEAINELFAIIAKNKDWNEGAARAKLLTFFEALGFAHPLAIAGRRKLSSILFA